MSTWTNVPDSVLEPGDPIRSVDIIAIKNNIIAVPGGATGAPRIADAALGTTVTSAGTNWVLARTAAASVGAVGTYAFLRSNNTTTVSPGGTKAGSNLRYSGVRFQGQGTALGPIDSAPSGTWRCMGFDSSDAYFGHTAATLWLRIS